MGRKKERTDKELLEIAGKVFLEHGPNVATSVIAKAAEVSQATLFNRFGDKKTLLLRSLAPPPTNPAIELMEQPPDQRPIPVQLVEVGHVLYKFMRLNEPRVACIKAAGYTLVDLMHENIEVPIQRGPQALAGWIEAAQAAGRVSEDIDVFALMVAFAGSIKNLAMEEHFAFVRKDEQLVFHTITHLVDLLWRGLEPKTKDE